MSAFCSFCVHHVALNGEAVKSNGAGHQVALKGEAVKSNLFTSRPLFSQQENIAISYKLFYNQKKALQYWRAGKRDEGASKHI